MKKIIIAFLSILFISAGITAQNKAKKLLDEVAQKAASYKNIYLEFSHKIENKIANMKQETKGNVTLAGDLYRFTYLGSEKIFDGKKTYLLIHEDKEIIVENSYEEEGMLTPSKIFSFYKKGFQYKMGALNNEKGKWIQYVHLTPTDTSTDIASILIGIDHKTKHIISISETGKNSTITTFKVINFKKNQPISDTLFSLDTKKYVQQKKYTLIAPN